MSAAESRIRRIRGVSPYPSGPRVLDEWLPLLDKFDVGSLGPDVPGKTSVAVIERAGSAMRLMWEHHGMPLWWVDDETEADLMDVPPPAGMRFGDVDWPFPAFGLVFKDCIILTLVDDNLKQLNPISGVVEAAFMAVTLIPRGPVSGWSFQKRMFSDLLSDAFNCSEMDDRASPEQAAVGRRISRLSVGSCLLLASHSGEEMRRCILPPPPLGKNPTRAQRAAGMINPPWLRDAATRSAKSVGWGEGASPVAHWRRAHWRLAHVGAGGLDRRLIKVRHALVNSAALTATTFGVIDTKQTA